MRRLADCPLLLRFDFQDALEARLRSRISEGPRFVAVGISGGMCEPASYIEACRQVADGLVEENCLDRQQAERRLEQIVDRIEQFKAWVASQVAAAGLKDAPGALQHAPRSVLRVPGSEGGCHVYRGR